MPKNNRHTPEPMDDQGDLNEHEIMPLDDDFTASDGVEMDVIEENPFGAPPIPVVSPEDEDPEMDLPSMPGMGSKPASGDDNMLDLDFLEDDVALIPAALYPARLAESRQTVSKNSQNPLLIMDFVLLNHPEVPAVYRGKEFPLFLALIPAVAWKLKRVGEALGFKMVKGARVNMDTLQNTLCYVEIEHREYQGEMRASVKDVYVFDSDQPGMKWTPGMTFSDMPG